ncbi:PD-(D/E)XK nuclease family protein [Arthrobacter yangruifuii]|uniref:PD-(D/E)XK nuclease family protein n=1 Tax=Arthrobacter yangruifuii TaxID=2606616 RepID=UPI0011B7F139|nr:PD-(D/E)XK nuclease family protein [Arthrobacter yangruifuii]
MTEPALAHATEYGRMYSRSLSEPPTVPSITTVISQGSTSLDGWHSYMAASAVVKDPKLTAALGSPSQLRSVVKEASSASERYRDAAAQRGTRVHYYCEQVALRALDRPHEVERAREELSARGEHQFADRFDEWWKLYDVQPLAPEITVWNAELGYAGTLDLVARIGGRLCLIDYKTKNTDRDGQVKQLDDKVVMQLVAGMKAQESLVDAGAGIWEPWAYGQSPLLLGVAVGQTEVRPMRANPDVLPQHWFKFCALRRVWQTSIDAVAAGRALLPVPPPPVGAHETPAPQAAPQEAPGPETADPQTSVPAGAPRP